MSHFITVTVVSAITIIDFQDLASRGHGRQAEAKASEHMSQRQAQSFLCTSQAELADPKPLATKPHVLI